MIAPPCGVRTSKFELGALKLPSFLFLEISKTPPPKYPPALRVQENEVPHGVGRSCSAPGFPSEEGGTRRGAPRSPCARSAVCYFDADPWKLMVRGFIKWGHSSYRMNSCPTDSP